ncbi:malonate transporter [Bradyrhizobium sp. LB7.2]
MATMLIVAPVFALIAAGYAAVLFRFVSETAHKGISEFAFSIAIPALLFRTIVVSEFSGVSPWRMWGAYYGALALTWIAALALSALLRKRREDREDGVVFAIGSVYGNIVMLGIPLTLSALGNEAAGPMALILSVNTPLLWLCGTLQMELVDRKQTASAASLILPVLLDLSRNPIMLAIGLGLLWRLTGLGLHPVVDRTVELLAQAGSPAALIALGINLFRFRGQGREARHSRDERAKTTGDAGGRVRAGKAARPAAARGRRRRAVRGDADRGERVHLRGPVSAAGEPGVGRGGPGHAAGGGDAAGGGVGGGGVR